MAEDSMIISERESEAHRTLRCLDEIGKRVTVLREQALTLMREKEDMLSLLQDLQDNKSIACSKAERDEIQAITEMLVCRCLTVEISVTTPRDENQELALSKVQILLKDLDSMFKTDVECAKSTAESYLNACLPEPRGNSTDHKFQGLVLGCAADDQKAVRKRLETLLANLKYM